VPQGTWALAKELASNKHNAEMENLVITIYDDDF
jgi:hypothetical protein